MRIRNFIFIGIVMLTAANAFAQTETYDIATFDAPRGWQRTDGQSGLAFSNVDRVSGKFCMIAIYPSTASAGSIENEFRTEWQQHIAKTLSTTATPSLQKPFKNGAWDVQMGVAAVKSDGVDMVALLAVFSNSERTMSVLVSLNDMKYESEFQGFLKSLELAKTPKSQAVQPFSPNQSGLPYNIVGTWGDVSSGDFGVRDSSGVVSTGRGGSGRFYHFSANGTYTFATSSDIVLNGSRVQSHETGRWTIAGGTLTLTPVNSIYRRNGVEESPAPDWRKARTYGWRIEKDGAATNLVLITGTFEDRLMWNR